MRTQLLYRTRALQIICLVLLGSPLLPACSPGDPDTVVQVCGNLNMPGEIDSLRVVITDQDNNILREGVRELWTCPGPSLMQLPQTLEFAPVDGDVFVRIQGIRGGVPVIENTLRKTLTPEDSRATISLEQGCLGVQCAQGETCTQGACQLIALGSDTISACAGLSTHADPGEDASDAAPDAGAGDSADPAGAHLCPQPDAGTREDPDAAQDQSALNNNGADANEGS